MSRPLFCAAVLCTAFSAHAADDVAAPTAADLPALIECRDHDVSAWLGFAFPLFQDEDGSVARALGLTAEDSATPWLRQYRLERPITAFGRSTDRIVFTNAGVMGVFDEADPHPLAEQLRIQPMLDTPAKYLGEAVVAESEERHDDGGVAYRTRITHDVSTLDSHPGKTLAGCSYRMLME
ncbi:hypothetical protein LDO31_15080 [Luteimonas sp. XNQY3]|nr:hypothetical protein [Luteimonas sp. XNQY3]MCD9007537.1 hypothetical protein [Luteimonas sp. XNQY3]